LVPPNVVGEVWISSDDLLPKFFWSLPKLSAKIFHAYPILLQKYVNGLNEYNLVPLMKRRFMKTGLAGFLSTDHRLFILGTLKEMISQSSMSTNEETARWQSPGLAHLTSHLMTTLLQIFPEVICG
jgi:acyl-CoA synthetase (AMP-forming)/AMP-acid ligase II